MTINIMQGNTAKFAVEFLDANGNLTTPSSGTLVIAYTATTGSTASVTISLALNQPGIFTGSWGSSVALGGFANWSVSAPGLVFTPAATGTLRIIDG